jgi:hypothetical protein
MPPYPYRASAAPKLTADTLLTPCMASGASWGGGGGARALCATCFFARTPLTSEVRIRHWIQPWMGRGRLPRRWPPLPSNISSHIYAMDLCLMCFATPCPMDVPPEFRWMYLPIGYLRNSELVNGGCPDLLISRERRWWSVFQPENIGGCIS